MVYYGSSWRWIMLFPGLVTVYLAAMGKLKSYKCYLIQLIMKLGSEICYLIWIINPCLVLGNDRDIMLPFFVIANSTIITTSALIAGRLLLIRKRVASILGPEHSKQYTSIIAMIVESATLVSVFSIIYMILYAVGNPVQEIFLFSITQVMVLIFVSAF